MLQTVTYSTYSLIVKKFHVLAKTSIFDQNGDFYQIFRFLTKTWIFNQNLGFRSKPWYSIKTLGQTFDQSYDQTFDQTFDQSFDQTFNQFFDQTFDQTISDQITVLTKQKKSYFSAIYTFFGNLIRTNYTRIRRRLLKTLFCKRFMRQILWKLIKVI